MYPVTDLTSWGEEEAVSRRTTNGGGIVASDERSHGQVGQQLLLLYMLRDRPASCTQIRMLCTLRIATVRMQPHFTVECC